MNKVKISLPQRFTEQLGRGVTVATMSREVMSGTQPLIDAMDVANTDMQTKINDADAARQAAAEATAALHASARAHHDAFGNLGGHVNTMSDGSDAFILSTGYEVRKTPAPRPPIEEAPSNVRTRVNGVPGTVTVLWKNPAATRNAEVQYTTDLSGLTGSISLTETPGRGRASVPGLESGTKYAFHVRALSNGIPGPWSGPVQQMAP